MMTYEIENSGAFASLSDATHAYREIMNEAKKYGVEIREVQFNDYDKKQTDFVIFATREDLNLFKLLSETFRETEYVKWVTVDEYIGY